MQITSRCLRHPASAPPTIPEEKKKKGRHRFQSTYPTPASSEYHPSVPPPYTKTTPFRHAHFEDVVRQPPGPMTPAFPPLNTSRITPSPISDGSIATYFVPCMGYLFPLPPNCGEDVAAMLNEGVNVTYAKGRPIFGLPSTCTSRVPRAPVQDASSGHSVQSSTLFDASESLSGSNSRHNAPSKRTGRRYTQGFKAPKRPNFF
ncbi:SubName: Full=Uncharacterized protein {ECO:0000313/EMBL:CCA76570.1} [Serendipita indica DSM 11827]|uniref:Uncharacterized protein n=1 Tax=Serendipita indica (strain DSM 11827) TaxID=1109443 RepID=G4TZ27_SERID|nr:SubName: Full=Uncharacterized protein {ECO:0000313/EMBL:CCA76570.1} [Serendipita indica DSM 11827]CCA76570.1 hypothetical protein PIIN_10562 [Serendipita indica DSM 11827]